MAASVSDVERPDLDLLADGGIECTVGDLA
jgi:hypothetical protein